MWSVIYQLCSRPATGGPLRNRARSEFAAVLDQHLADVEFTPDNLPDLARRVFDYAQANPGASIGARMGDARDLVSLPLRDA